MDSEIDLQTINLIIIILNYNYITHYLKSNKLLTAWLYAVSYFLDSFSEYFPFQDSFWFKMYRNTQRVKHIWRQILKFELDSL